MTAGEFSADTAPSQNEALGPTGEPGASSPEAWVLEHVLSVNGVNGVRGKSTHCAQSLALRELPAQKCEGGG